MSIEFLTVADRSLAYQRQFGDASRPGVIFLGGFASDMTGSKASYLADRCAENHLSFVRFDYSGCGQSKGSFKDGTISLWLADALAVLDQLSQGPQIIVGSSMGGWIALLMARARPDRLKAFIGVAAAPDFTEDLISEKLTKPQREALMVEGQIIEDNAPPEHQVPITLKLLEDAREHLVLRSNLTVPCPVRLMQGLKDTEVPFEYAARISAHVHQDDVRVTLIKNGDHRLSTPQNLELLWQLVAEFIGPKV